MIFFSPQKDPDWLGKILPVLATEGVAVVESVIDADFIERAWEAIYGVQKKIWADVGKEKLDQAGELGVLRLMMKYDPFFFKFLELPEVLEIINQTVSPTAVLHTQNGFVLPSFPKSGTPQVFQNQFHMDFPRVFKGHMLSINAYFAIDEFRADNGATLVVPGSHQRETRPEQAEIEAKAVPAECPAGSMIVFDSTLWHAAGRNTSGKDRLSLNHQFTRSYFKQQIDYVRALGDSLVLAQKPRVQQLLGWYTRVPTSLNDYYKPQEERLYRKEQG